MCGNQTHNHSGIINVGTDCIGRCQSITLRLQPQ